MNRMEKSRLKKARHWKTILGFLLLMMFLIPVILLIVQSLAGIWQWPKIIPQNLGANWLRLILEIELPLLVPAIVSGGSVVFLAAFSDYYLVFLIGGGAVYGYSGYLFPFLNSSNRSMAALLNLIFLAFPLILFGLI